MPNRWIRASGVAHGGGPRGGATQKPPAPSGRDFIRRHKNRQSKKRAARPARVRRWSGSFRCRRCARGR